MENLVRRARKKNLNRFNISSILMNNPFNLFNLFNFFFQHLSYPLYINFSPKFSVKIFRSLLRSKNEGFGNGRASLDRIAPFIETKGGKKIKREIPFTFPYTRVEKSRWSKYADERMGGGGAWEYRGKVELTNAIGSTFLLVKSKSVREDRSIRDSSASQIFNVIKWK